MAMGTRFGANSVLILTNGNEVYLENTPENLSNQMADGKLENCNITVSSLVREDMNYKIKKDKISGFRLI